MNRTGQTYRQMIRVLMTVSLVFGVVGAATADSEEEQLRQAAYEKIMEIIFASKIGRSSGAEPPGKVGDRASVYRKVRNSKVMSACIEWSGNEVDDLRVLAWQGTDSRKAIMGQIRRHNLTRCNGRIKGKGYDCKCQIVDENDKNKLKLPEEWKARVLGWSGRDLRSANLQGASFKHADLQGFDLAGANLQKANLTGANLQHANLAGASLQNAYLQMANLQGANFRNAKFQKAMLNAANIQGANLQGADLSRARGLTQEQLDEACGDENTRLPDNLTIKPCSKDNK